MPADARSGLPSVSRLLDQPAIAGLIAAHSRPLVLRAIQTTLDGLRRTLAADADGPSLDAVVAAVTSELVDRIELDRLRPVVNATGVLLHTGLGRAPLPPVAARALADGWQCVNMQIDLETGRRGRRNHLCEQLLCLLTGAEAAMIVNNNAGATLLVLAALCEGRDVIVSRGQLIEIGGSYRLPDCITRSGARMVEVGTTNKTHLRDYAAALGEQTGAVLRVNPSNYRIVGFTRDVSIAELVSLKRDRPDLLVLDDLGCGALTSLEPFGLPAEPTVPDSVAAGADLSFFSGDKLIGGPQAGIIVGRRDLIQTIRKHPLTRMLRVDKLTDLALEHTLRLFLDPESLPRTHPLYRMLTEPLEALRARAEALADGANGAGGGALAARVVDAQSATGGGSLPGAAIPSVALALTASQAGADALSRLLRRNEPPIIGRIEDDAVLLDMRTLLEGEETLVAQALDRLASSLRERRARS